MLFSSMTFVFLFLPIVCLLYFLAGKDFKNHILLISSILFYAWGEPSYLAVMIATILLNYFAALWVARAVNYRRLIVGLAVMLNLSFLVYFKYFNFIVFNINNWASADIPFLEVIMPIGISFYTFQAMSYLIDVYRGEVEVQRDVYKLALYVSLFPQLVAGPIVKYHDVANQIDEREINLPKVAFGVRRFIVGLAKKMLIANTAGAIVDKIFNQSVESFDPFTAWLGIIAYAIQVYYDFSGYSDMAIGLGMIFGFDFLENFNYPYISKSITEFWRRWHISLSTWFKEYVYFPLGGSRVSKWRVYCNLLIVFAATGIWHGAEWTFLVWGLWYGVFILLEKAINFTKDSSNKLVNSFKHFYTMVVFLVGLVIFRSINLSYAWSYIKNMFGLIGEHTIGYKLGYYIDNGEILALTVGIICSIPIFRDMLKVRHERKILKFVIDIWLICLFVLSAATIASSTYNPFIYFRF